MCVCFCCLICIFLLLLLLLQSASRVILFEFDWNPTIDEQAIARAWRLGQQRDVVVYRFVAHSTTEASILRFNHMKTKVNYRVIDRKDVKRSVSAKSAVRDDDDDDDGGDADGSTDEQRLEARRKILEAIESDAALKRVCTANRRIKALIAAVKVIDPTPLQDAPLNDEEKAAASSDMYTHLLRDSSRRMTRAGRSQLARLAAQNGIQNPELVMDELAPGIGAPPPSSVARSTTTSVAAAAPTK